VLMTVGCSTASSGDFARVLPGRTFQHDMARIRHVRTASTAGAGPVIGAMILEAVSVAYEGDVQMIDSSSIRVHQHGANGDKKGDPVAWAVRAAA
jgi:hypothetical protein